MPPGYSLQRSGAGRTRDDFHWAGPLPASPGRLNDYQAPARPVAPGAPASGLAVNRVSGWHTGLPVPDGLVAPLADGGTDEDAPAAARSPDAAPRDARATLRLGLPAPNPARHVVRIAIEAPPDARLSAEVTDALGRTVLRLDTTPGTAALDVSRLAAGVYILRVTDVCTADACATDGPAARRFTVAP